MNEVMENYNAYLSYEHIVKNHQKSEQETDKAILQTPHPVNDHNKHSWQGELQW